jgi:hypothetical protein
LELLLIDMTQVNDAGLAHLTGLINLKTLLMDATKVSDEGMAYLEQLRNLETVIVPPDRISSQAIERLREALPDAFINERPMRAGGRGRLR